MCQINNYKSVLPAGWLIPMVSNYPNEIVTLDLLGQYLVSRTVTPTTSGYNLRSRIGKEESDRPLRGRHNKDDQCDPEKGRERNDSPYIEERTRSSNKNARRGCDHCRQGRKGEERVQRNSCHWRSW
ncbi:hypothetical protein TNCV_1053221 [Trichonephila clavipes]|nr:hypothetical protein TNCV_1053221 [Trichonephila clavipes]